MTINQVPRRRQGVPPPAVRRFLLPAVVGVIQVIGTRFAAFGQPERMDLDALGVLLLAVGPGSLIVRRRYPVAVLAFVLVTTLAYLLTDYPRGPIFFALIVAFVTAVMTGHRPAAVVSLVVGYVSFLWLPYLLDIEQAPTWAHALGLGAWLLVLLGLAEVAGDDESRQSSPPGPALRRSAGAQARNGCE